MFATLLEVLSLLDPRRAARIPKGVALLLVGLALFASYLVFG